MIKLNDSHGGDWDEWEEHGEADLKTRELPKAFHDYRKDEMKISSKLRPSPKKPGPEDHGLTKEETVDFRRLDKKVRKGGGNVRRGWHGDGGDPRPPALEGRRP